jgi:hypothetical protein
MTQSYERDEKGRRGTKGEDTKEIISPGISAIFPTSKKIFTIKKNVHSLTHSLS